MGQDQERARTHTPAQLLVIYSRPKLVRLLLILERKDGKDAWVSPVFRLTLPFVQAVNGSKPARFAQYVCHRHDFICVGRLQILTHWCRVVVDPT